MSKDKLTLDRLQKEIYMIHFEKILTTFDFADRVKSLIKQYARECCEEDRNEIKDMYPDLKHSWVSKKPFPKEIQE